jgi:cell division transport system permease protein
MTRLARLFRSLPGSSHPGIVPARSLAARTLVLVIVIMTFLAGLTVGAVDLVLASAADWSRGIAREATIQIRPVPGRGIDADVALAETLAREVEGVREVQSLTRAQSERLLEPWLGTGLDLGDLPVPRLVAITFGLETPPDLESLRRKLSERLPNASLDDHGLWLTRLSRMADLLAGVGLVVLALVLSATGLTVAFATRGAMAGTQPIIEVLHLVGAEDRFIAGAFQRHFLLLGLRGGAIGGILAIAFFALAGVLATHGSKDMAAASAWEAFGAFGTPGGFYLRIAGVAAIVAALVTIVSRITVFRTLRAAD